jgi:galactitol-specific phosphotransferase system IIB component
MKKILLSAGGALAITVLDRITNGLKERGLAGQFTLTKCKVTELAQKAPGYDIVIRTAMLTGKIDKPLINGVGLAAGGQAAGAVLDEIAALVKAPD